MQKHYCQGIICKTKIYYIIISLGDQIKLINLEILD